MIARVSQAVAIVDFLMTPPTNCTFVATTTPSLGGTRACAQANVGWSLMKSTLPSRCQVTSYEAQQTPQSSQHPGTFPQPLLSLALTCADSRIGVTGDAPSNS